MKKLLGYKLAVYWHWLVLLNAGLVEVARAQTPDPGVPGPLAVTREEYNLWRYCIYSNRLPWLRSSCWRRCIIRRGCRADPIR